MTSGNDRLDQIAALLQQSIAASDQRMTRIEQAMAASDERMTRIEERLGQLAESQEVTDAQVGVLVTAIDELAVRVDRIVIYLENQSGNGRGGTGGQPQP